MAIPKRVLGKTGQEVTVLGLGGEGVLRTRGQHTRARQVIEEAAEAMRERRLGYTPALGLPELREAIAEDYWNKYQAFAIFSCLNLHTCM